MPNWGQFQVGQSTRQQHPWTTFKVLGKQQQQQGGATAQKRKIDMVSPVEAEIQRAQALVKKQKGPKKKQAPKKKQSTKKQKAKETFAKPSWMST